MRLGGEVGRPAARRRHVLRVVGSAGLAEDRYLRFRSCARLEGRKAALVLFMTLITASFLKVKPFIALVFHTVILSKHHTYQR